MEAFRKAVEAEDLNAIAATLADDVVFRSPAARKPYAGKALTMVILSNVMEVFEDFTYVSSAGAEGDRNQVLVFEARIGDRELTGADFIRLNDDGLIEELMVMVRPLGGLIALAEAMGSRPEIQNASR